MCAVSLMEIMWTVNFYRLNMLRLMWATFLTADGLITVLMDALSDG